MTVLALLLLAPVLVDLVRRPTFRSIAVRSIGRRKGEALLVVVGSLLGTAIITASLVVGDTVEASIRDGARTQLGPIDETVRLSGPGQIDAAVAAITNPPIAGVDGTLPIQAAGAVIATRGADRRAEPGGAMVEVDFDAARRFGDDPVIGGLTDAGPTPTGDQAVISEVLAESLGVRSGDAVEVFAYGGSKVLTVRTVVPEVGIAGYAPGRSRGSTAAVFVPRGTIDGLVGAAAGSAAEPPSYEVLVSNTGGVFDSIAGSEGVSAELTARTAGIPGTEVGTVKADLLEQAEEEGASLTELFTSIGYFSVIAGILLLVNLFVMLSEERKTELGTLRALGFKRNHLVRTFAIEGAAYSVAAAALGAVVGIGVGWAVVRVTSGIFGDAGSSLRLTLAVEPASLVAGGSMGLVICLVTVWATSARIARLNIIRSIRDLPEPRQARSSIRPLIAGLLLAVLGVLGLAAGLSGPIPALVLAGPAVVLFGLTFVLGRFLPRKPVTVVLSLAALVWGIGVFTFLPDAMAEADLVVFVVQGVVLVTAGVATLSQADRAWASVARGVSSGGGLSARLGLAYPLSRTFRTALLLAMYSIVIFTMAFISVLAAIFGNQAPQFTEQVRAGHDVIVDSSQGNPVTADQLDAVPGVAGVATLTRGIAQATTSRHPEPSMSPLTGFDQGLVDRGAPVLESRGAAYASDADAYRAVLADPSLIIVGFGVGSQEENGAPGAIHLQPGDTVTLRDTATSTERRLTIAGVMEGDVVGNGGMVAEQALDDLLGPRKVANRHYVAVEPGADPDEVASRIKGSLVEHGADARSFHGLVEEQLQTQTSFFGLLRAYLGLGLLIGIAGLGVVMVRAVRERRREIGMLRAIGLPTRMVRRAFILEAAFITLQGILLGLGLGIVTSYNLLVNSGAFGDQELDFTWPWDVLAAIAVVPLVASLLATAWPATQAARIRPAAALRIAD
jgi:putative ABC transport system permease protein